MKTSPLNNSYGNAIWDIGLKAKKANFTDAFKIVFGNPGNGCPFTWWLRRIHNDDRKIIYKKFKAALHSESPKWDEMYRIKLEDGTYAYVQDMSHAVFKDGKLVRITRSFRNISKVKELEIQLCNERLSRQRKISEAIVRVTEKERTRLGQELHDNINQILSCANLYFDQVCPFNETEKQAKYKGHELIALAIEEIRKLSKELVLPQINGKNMIQHMEKLISHVHSVSPIKVEFEYLLEEGRPLTSGKATALFRILQEQLKNILIHSNASLVNICLRDDRDCVCFIIADNGVGATNIYGNGIGISNIRERVNFYNGNLTVQTKPGEGFKVKIWLPGNRKYSVLEPKPNKQIADL